MAIHAFGQFKGRLWGTLFCMVCSSLSAEAANIGYVVLGEPDNNSPASAIIAAGHTPQALSTLSGADFSSLHNLWILNPDNLEYLPDLTGNLAGINAFVSNGGYLVFHDRRVSGADAVIPGAGGITFVSAFSNNIVITAESGGLLSGPGGVFVDGSLDGADSSNHGYAMVATLPEGAVVTLTQADVAKAVDFYYTQGAGRVYYSSIPLDHFFLNDGELGAAFHLYAVNLAAYIFNAAGGATAVSTPAQHAQLPLFWNAAERLELFRARLDQLQEVGRDRLLAQRTPVRLASVGHGRIDFPADSSRDGFFADVSGGRFDQEADGTLDGYTGHTLNVMFGYERALRPDIALGVVVGYSDVETDSFVSDGGSESRLYDVTAYGRKYLTDVTRPGAADLYLDGVVGLRAGEMNISRSNNIHGDTEVSQGYVSARLGADIVFSDAFTVSPYIGTQMVSTRISGFDEKGAGALSYGLSEGSYWELFTGARLAKKFHAEGMNVLLSGAAELHQALDRRTPAVAASLSGFAGTASEVGLHSLPRVYGSIRLGLEVSPRKNMSGHMNVQAYASDDGNATGYSAGAGLRVDF